MINKIIKIRREIEYFQSTCNKCGMIIQGQTEDVVKNNIKIHTNSKNCKLKQKVIKR